MNERNVKQILSDRTQFAPPGPGSETMVFSVLHQTEYPDALHISAQVAFGVFAGGILLMLAGVYWTELDDPIQKASAMAAIVTLFGWAGWAAYRQRREVALVIDALHEGIETVRTISDRLNAFRTDFDNRTRRYFHCVTSNKVQAYFVLNQLQEALLKRLEALDVLLQIPSRRNAAAAHKLLYSNFYFTDSANSASGMRRTVRPEHLEPVLAEIIESLERGIEELEMEIAEAEESQWLYSRPNPDSDE